MIKAAVIDANIFKCYYEVAVHGKSHVSTDCPKKLFENLGTKFISYFDEGGIIKQEWENLVDRQWFETWFGDMLWSANFVFIEPKRDNSLEVKIKNQGFPNSKDIMYIRTSCAIVEIEEECLFFTEDIDFYDPKYKKSASKTRLKILNNCSGPINKILRKADIYAIPLSRA